MKKILIYGDSNTWGDDFFGGKRIPDEKQWPNILQKKLGSDYKIIQEGLPGRLAGNDEKEKLYRNGKDTFLSIFRTASPVDEIIIALGTNDLQIKYQKDAKKTIEDLLDYSKIVENLFADDDDRIKYFTNETMPKIKYLLPINFDYLGNARIILDENSEKKRIEIINYFEKNEKNYIKLEKLELLEDGVHLNYIGHEKVAEKVLGEIRTDFQ